MLNIIMQMVKRAHIYPKLRPNNQGDDFLIKPLSDFAKHMRGLVQDIPADYAISSICKNMYGEENIRNGVLAFRDFLCQFFDYVVASADLHDKPKPNANRVWGGINFTMDYPFLRDMSAVLMNIGIYGELNESGDTLVIGGNELFDVLKKAKVSKAAVYLRYLTDCGIECPGIDLDTEKPNLTNIPILEISYPDNPAMLVGLKIMANAQLEQNKKRFKAGTWACVNTIDNVFLRCDYNALEENAVEQISLIKSIIKPFPAETQKMVFSLHQRLLDSGFICEITTGRNSAIGFYLLYAYKTKPKRVVQASWIIGITPNNCGIKIDAKNVSEYSDIIEKFPADLLELIKNGEGCIYNPAPKKCQVQNTGYKFIVNGIEHIKCSVKTCSNNDFWIPLVDLTNEKILSIEDWINKELSF